VAAPGAAGSSSGAPYPPAQPHPSAMEPPKKPQQAGMPPPAGYPGAGGQGGGAWARDRLQQLQLHLCKGSSHKWQGLCAQQRWQLLLLHSNLQHTPACFQPLLSLFLLLTCTQVLPLRGPTRQQLEGPSTLPLAATHPRAQAPPLATL
jgi:hypothetical protein